MTDYEELISNVFEVIKEIKGYSLGELERIIKDEKIPDENFLKNWEELTQQVCYGRKYCKLLEVDYFNLPSEDLKKISVFTLYLLKKNRNFELPYLY